MAGRLSRWPRGIALASHLALIVALPVVARVPGLLLALPLLAPLPGLVRGRPYTHAWCSLLIVFYVGGFLMEASSGSAHRTIALALAVLAATEFIALLSYVRFRAVEERRAQAAPAGDPPPG